MIKNITGIMAVANNGVVGLNGKLPWYSSNDIEFFEKITENQVIIMGRKTYESLPSNVLYDRKAIVFSRNPTYSSNKAKIIHSVEDLLRIDYPDGGVHYFMIGGAEIAHLFFENNLILQFVLTEINGMYYGDTYLDLNYFCGWKKKVLVHTNEYSRYLFMKK